MPVSCEELNRACSIDFPAVMAEENITARSLAKQIKKELSAKESKFFKIRKGGESNDVTPKRGRPKSGAARIICDGGPLGESLVAVDCVAWNIRQTARMDAQKLLSLYPIETKRIQLDEATLNAILTGLPAGVGEAVRAELGRIVSAKRD